MIIDYYMNFYKNEIRFSETTAPDRESDDSRHAVATGSVSASK
jgi:hypothetical protein